MDPRRCSMEGEYNYNINISKNEKVPTTVEELIARYNIKVTCLCCGTELILLDYAKGLEENNKSSGDNLQPFLRLWKENQKNTTD